VKKILIFVSAAFALLIFYINTQTGISNVDKDSVLSVEKEHLNTSDKNNLEESDIKAIAHNDENKSNVTSNVLEPEIHQALEKHLNTSSEGLVEDETDDGYNVNLQGRFRSVPVATIKEDGEIYIKDYTSLPEQSKQ